VYYTRARNLGQASEVGLRSRRSIDEYHHRFMQEHTEEPVRLETLIDLVV
jgi:hypothetical protein